MTRYRLFNPGQLGDDDLVAGFVARHRELDDLLGIIRHQPESGPLQHVLLIGERGMGKTTLGLRTLIAVRRDPELSRLWQPVPFGEESYRVTSLGKLWLEALGQLSAATGEPRWAQSADDLRRGEKDDARMAARARALLTEFRNETGRRPILFIENLDELFGQFADDKDTARLRADLQTHDDFMLLATATRHFRAISDHGQPFYQFFRLIDLCGLDRASTIDIVDAVAIDLDCTALRRAEQMRSGRVETIRTLTGGNPRLIHLTARLVAQAPHGTAMTDLEELIDEQTPYFKARVDALPSQQRELVQTLATLWKPATAASLGEAVRLGTSQVSAQLKKLEKDGFVHRLDVPGSKRAHYEVSARLYTLYFVLRFTRGERERLERLVDFLMALYGPAAASSILEGARQRLADPESPTRWADGIIMEKLLPLIGDTVGGRARGILEQARSVALRIHEMVKIGDMDGARVAYEKITAVAQAHPDEPTLREMQATVATNLVVGFGKASELAAAQAVYEEITNLAQAHPDEPALRTWQARAAGCLAARYALARDYTKVDELGEASTLGNDPETHSMVLWLLALTAFSRADWNKFIARMDDTIKTVRTGDDLTDSLSEAAVLWILYASCRPAGVVLGAMERLGIADRMEPLYHVLQVETGIVLPPLPQEVRLAMDVVRELLAALRGGNNPADVFEQADTLSAAVSSTA